MSSRSLTLAICCLAASCADDVDDLGYAGAELGLDTPAFAPPIDQQWTPQAGGPSSCLQLSDIPQTSGVDGATVLYVNQDIRLCPRSEPVFGARFIIGRSNVSLDCSGVVFDGKLAGDLEVAKWALTVAKENGSGQSISDVTISGCTFKNYDRGIVLGTGRRIADMSPELGLQRFTVRDTSVHRAAKEGLIVGPYNTDTLLDGLTVDNAFLSGVYLEAYSQRTTIRNSRFIDNGYTGSARGREGIAIDSSSHNTIVDNEFVNNRYAGITTYKNCGESSAKDGRAGTPRTMHASYNVISHNIFKYHDNLEGGGGAIILASRQGNSYPSSHGCTDTPAADGRYYDYSRGNLVKENSFINNVTSIKIADSYTRVEGNTFTGTAWTDAYTGRLRRATYDVAIGSSFLRDQGRPVRGIAIVNNVTRTSTTNNSGRTFVPLHGSTVAFYENTDRFYRCIADRLAPGNTCSGSLPANRCEVTATACPARSSMPNFSDFPSSFLDTCYGSNILPDVCANRARDLWRWCATSRERSFTVTTTAIRDGAVVLESVYDHQ